ncbi:MAG: hypothetical protein RI967_831 [Planctomycetota bacterium]
MDDDPHFSTEPGGTGHAPEALPTVPFHPARAEEVGSRRGIGVGSTSPRPHGMPHRPHPGTRERTIGTARVVDERTVMRAMFRPRKPTKTARGIDAPASAERWKNERFKRTPTDGANRAPSAIALIS